MHQSTVCPHTIYGEDGGCKARQRWKPSNILESLNNKMHFYDDEKTDFPQNHRVFYEQQNSISFREWNFPSSETGGKVFFSIACHQHFLLLAIAIPF